jgi:hypothetical protein
MTVGVYSPRDNHGDDGAGHPRRFTRTQNAGVKALDADVIRRISGNAITIIGAPAFLIASNTLQQSGRGGLGIFSIAPIGLALSLVGRIRSAHRSLPAAEP